MQHLIDKSPILSTCNRCKAYVLAGMDSGCEYAVDVTPLSDMNTKALILCGVRVFRTAPRGRMRALTASAFNFEGQRYKEHSCQCFTTPVEVPEDPPHAPVTAEQAVLCGEGLTSSPVASARRLRSEYPPVRCSECGALINEGEDRMQIEVPVWQTNVHKVPNRGSRKGYTKTIEGWGVKRWTSHPHGCPVSTNG